MAATPLVVAILAGGAATRLGGRDKGLEPLAGRPLIQWVVDAVREMEALFKSSPSRGRVGISRDMSRADERLHKDVQTGLASTGMCEGLSGDGVRDAATGVAPGSVPTLLELLIVANRNHDAYARYAPTITDLVPGFRGPLAGVAAALAACAAPLLLTVPVDCPGPPHDLASRLAQALGEGAADAAVAHDGERRQPLFALYRRSLAASAARAAAAGQGVWQWQTSIGATELDFSDRHRQFQNLNTAEDFAAYAAEHGFDP